MGSGCSRWAGAPNCGVRAPLPRMGRPNRFGVGTGPGEGLRPRPGSWSTRWKRDLMASGGSAQPLWTAISTVDRIGRREAAEAVLEGNLGWVEVERLQGRILHRHDQAAGRDGWPWSADRLGLAAFGGIEALAVAGQQEAGRIGTGQVGTFGIEGPSRVQGRGRRQRFRPQVCRRGRCQCQQQCGCGPQPGQGRWKSARGHAALALWRCIQSAGCARIHWCAPAL